MANVHVKLKRSVEKLSVDMQNMQDGQKINQYNILESQWRSMRNNLLFHGLPESTGDDEAGDINDPWNVRNQELLNTDTVDDNDDAGDESEDDEDENDDEDDDGQERHAEEEEDTEDLFDNTLYDNSLSCFYKSTDAVAIQSTLIDDSIDVTSLFEPNTASGNDNPVVQPISIN